MKNGQGNVAGRLAALFLMLGLASFVRVGAANAQTREAASVVTLHGDRTGAPMNPFIYGQFIEHLGRCIYGGIWAEMLEDRKFYFPITADYRPYRQLEDTRFPVVGASPWQIIGSADSVTMVKENAFVGEHTPRIKAGAGIRQRDLATVQGKEYVGYIWLSAPKGTASVDVVLVCGEDGQARQMVRIKNVRGKYHKHTLKFKADRKSVV